MTKDEQIKEWVRQVVNYHHEDIPDPHKMLIICNKGDYDCWVSEFFNTYGFKMRFYPHLPTQFFLMHQPEIFTRSITNIM